MPIPEVAPDVTAKRQDGFFASSELHVPVFEVNSVTLELSAGAAKVSGRFG
jgi:hypothetical protein